MDNFEGVEDIGSDYVDVFVFGVVEVFVEVSSVFVGKFVNDNGVF